MQEPSWGLVLMDVIKTTVPALIVFLTVYYLIKQFFKSQTELTHLKVVSEQGDSTKNIKLQAFERLMLYCDRMDIVNMAMRLNTTDMTSEQLMQAMLISVQKEYEHNVAQQIYVSDTLWQVISQAKSSTVQLISSAFQTVSKTSSSRDLLEAISKKMEAVQLNPADSAKRALRSEAATMLV